MTMWDWLAGLSFGGGLCVGFVIVVVTLCLCAAAVDVANAFFGRGGPTQDEES